MQLRCPSLHTAVWMQFPLLHAYPEAQFCGTLYLPFAPQVLTAEEPEHTLVPALQSAHTPFMQP